MKKRSWARILLWTILAIIGTPIVVIFLIIALLYIPSVQRAVVDKTCKEISLKSGYDVEIGSINLILPLKLKVRDYSMSKNDSVYLQGKHFDANISLMPLLSGRVEVNYISLEGVEMDTRDMLPELSIDGKVGYARIVARDADLTRSVADIRQLYIADTEIDIALCDTIADEEDSESLQWIINLHKGYIKNSRIGFSMPLDTLRATAYIEKLKLRNGSMDLGATAFAIDGLALNNSQITYDKGVATAEESPLDHIALRNININARQMRYTAFNDISANIENLTFEQPEGLAITDAAVHFTSDNKAMQLHKLEIDSRNGSHIYGQTTIPLKSLIKSEGERFTATLLADIRKADLARLVTPKMYESLDIFEEQLLEANATLSGDIGKINIDTIAITSPGLGTVNASGNIKNILRPDKTDGGIAFNGKLYDVGKFIECNDSVDRSIIAHGNILYSGGVITTAIALDNPNGEIAANGSYSIADSIYNATVTVERFALAEILPQIPLHSLKMQLNATGNSIDLFNTSTCYNADITIDTIQYADCKLHTINAKVSQADCISQINIDGHDKKLLFGIDATTMFADTGIENRTSIELANADFKEIGLVDSALQISTKIDISATTDLKETHSLKVAGTRTGITTGKNRFTPADLSIDFATSPALTSMKVDNGDLNIDGEMDCGYKALFAAMQEIATMNSNMISGKRDLYHLHDYEEVLPRISLDFTCGEKNMLHNFLVFNGIEAKGIGFGADISKSKGLNIKGDIIKFRTAGIALDSIKFATRQNHDRLSYIIGATELSIASDDDENSQSALLYGSIKCDTITSNFVLRDNIKKTDSKIGLTAHIKPGNIHMHFNPEAMLFGAPYAFNRDNYINIGKAMSVNADVTFMGGNDNGFHLYTTPDEKAAYNINLDIFNINLGEIAEAIPGVPDVTGKFFAQLNYRQSNDNNVFTCNANVDSLTYNSNIIGNERIELAYSPRASGAHALRCNVSHNGAKVAGIVGGMFNDRFRGNISITKLPLSITQAFIDKEGAMLYGYVNGKMDFSGKLTEMKSNGYLQLDSAYAYSPMLGALLHPADNMIMIENSKVNLKEYHIYDKVNTPFVINGNVDITNLLNPKLSLRLNATNYEILNTPQKAGKMVYGKMYVDLRSMIHGTLNDIRMMGGLTILSKSNFAYVLPEEASFDSGKDMDGLVEFVNFSDTTAVTQMVQPKIDLGEITANLTVNIQEGVKMSLDFDSSRENYVSIEGDGNLNATYDSQNGFGVTGIYNLAGGQVKLTLPIIPLRTFYIQEGGRLTWTGDLFNPTLDVTAYEKTTVSVEMDDNSIQPVVFNAGVVVSNTVNDLAVDFTISAPENAVIQNQLNELDRETLNRYAIAMIITGTYLGGKQGITASSALSSFIDAKINQISGNAIKDFDVNIGINDALNAETGNAYTNYSFSFSKRFFNDRITAVIGGEVNSGDRADKSAGNETFINNVSLEWRLNDSGNRYLRIFYDKNYQSLLEGEITETGVGYVYKRKLNRLKDLFTFKKKGKKAEKEAKEVKEEKKDIIQPGQTDRIRARE